MAKKANPTQKEAILRKELVSQICKETNGLFSKQEAQKIIGELSFKALECHNYELLITNKEGEFFSCLDDYYRPSCKIITLVGNHKPYDIDPTKKLAVLVKLKKKLLVVYFPTKN